jgi:hypothetical protein
MSRPEVAHAERFLRDAAGAVGVHALAASAWSAGEHLCQRVVGEARRHAVAAREDHVLGQQEVPGP